MSFDFADYVIKMCGIDDAGGFPFVFDGNDSCNPTV
jgi:hypothetical protein